MTATTTMQIIVLFLWFAVLSDCSSVLMKYLIEKQKFSEAIKCLSPSGFTLSAFGFGHLLIWTYLLTSGTITIK
ncbi:hypothetical protein [Neisseria subflava]|uniref:Uncharacterized protein n=1 Tax=Neisseria subflava NJ9703 TaxID=546268 RepID=A0A9W5IPK4_NEISU|nr:hypothetical protein [Neisseria subflava]EFC51405.1 hypothetical protein NEISUBOT_05132 [Neisseria subflava NJ9703]